MRDEKEERKQGQASNKARQHSTPKAVTFPNKNELLWVGLEPTTRKFIHVREMKNEVRRKRARSNKQQGKARVHNYNNVYEIVARKEGRSLGTRLQVGRWWAVSFGDPLPAGGDWRVCKYSNAD